ncbi:ubiquitin thioesterase OTU1 [Vulpes lagopus]|uniref:ubiquitin thioesterase OTU1 n=1 Tax=Vulpes lagopus TaxID=494514 RepID=UPI001BCA18F9|nr:ubiquitin thioesterase OTU1 [Vulpes lagopus]
MPRCRFRIPSLRPLSWSIYAAKARGHLTRSAGSKATWSVHSEVSILGLARGRRHRGTCHFKRVRASSRAEARAAANPRENCSPRRFLAMSGPAKGGHFGVPRAAGCPGGVCPPAAGTRAGRAAARSWTHTMWRLRCKAKDGTHVLQGLSSRTRVRELQGQIAAITGIAPGCQRILVGYPPEGLDLSDEDTVLGDLPIQSGKGGEPGAGESPGRTERGVRGGQRSWSAEAGGPRARKEQSGDSAVPGSKGLAPLSPHHRTGLADSRTEAAVDGELVVMRELCMEQSSSVQKTFPPALASNPPAK